MADPLPKYARVDQDNPEAWAQCDRCGFWRCRSDLVYQFQWGGMQIYNTQVLVCKERCYDIPNEQLRTIILPPDPPPIVNARVPNFAYEEYLPLISQIKTIPGNQPPWADGPELILCDQTGTVALSAQYTNTSPNQPRS